MLKNFKRILSVLLLVALCLSLIPFQPAFAASTDYTITLTTDGYDGKISNVLFYMGGSASPSLAKRALNIPITHTTQASNMMYIRTDVLDAAFGLYAVKVTIDSESYTQLISDLGSYSSGTYLSTSPKVLAESGSLAKVSVYWRGSNNLTFKTDNTGGALGGKNITFQYIFTPPQTQGYAASIAAGLENGSATATKIVTEENTWQLTAEPAFGYVLDYWEYRTAKDNDNFTGDYIKDAASFWQNQYMVTISQDTEYRAVFKKGNFVLKDGIVAIKGGGSGGYAQLGGGDPVFVSSGDNLKEFQQALFGVVFYSAHNLTELFPTIKIALYAGDVTADFESATPFQTYDVIWPNNQLPANTRIYYMLGVSEVPGMESVTVAVKLADGEDEWVYRNYALGAEIAQDPYRTQRQAALTEFRDEYFMKYGNDKFGNAYFTKDDPRNENYIKYSRYRFYLRSTYNTCLQNIKNAESAEAISTTLDASKLALEKASRGIGGEAIVWEKTLTVVPEGSAAITAWSAALETEYPGVWTIYKSGNPSYMTFGAFITGVATEGGKGSEDRNQLTSSYGLWYYNGKFSDLGISNYYISDGDYMCWGIWDVASGWNYGVLRYHFTDSELAETYNITSVDDVKALMDAGNFYSTFPNINFGRYGQFKELSADELAAIPVIEKINAIGTVTLDSETAITEARAAYAALATDGQKAAVKNYDVLLSAEETLAALKAAAENPTEYSEALNGALNYLGAIVTNPTVGSQNGEWAVLALARSGRVDAQSTFALTYLSNLDAALAAGNEITAETDYQRVTLALTALGLDASAYKSQNLTASYSAYDGDMLFNAKIFGLLALNSKPYTSSATSEYIDGILAEVLPNGGWNLYGTGDADVDITAMAIQALAPYYDTNQEVKDTVDEAIAVLQGLQDNATGGFNGYDGALSTSSTAQVVTALTALGMNPTSEDWTVTGGKTPMAALVTFYNEDYGYFGDTTTVLNQMATEQAAYALVAYDRFLHGENTLYNMSDVFAPKSSDAGVESITVSYGTSGTSSMVATKGEGNTFNVTLPYGTTLPTDPEDIIVKKAHRWASISELVSEGNKGEVWTFTITAQDGTSQTYTLNVTIAANPAAGNIEAVAAAKTAIESLTRSVPMAVANTQPAIKIWAETGIASLELNGVSTAVTVNTVTPATAGNADDKNGIDGEFILTVKLTKGEGENFATDSAEVTGVIGATKYISSNTGVSSVTIDGKAGIINGTTITVVLDYAEDAVLPTTPSAISIDTYDADAEVSEPYTEDDGETWTFTVTAEDGTTTENYTIYVSIAAGPAAGAQADIDAAISAIDNDSYSVSMTTANTEEDVKNWLENRIAAYPSVQGQDITVTTAVYGFEPAVIGTSENKSGINGSFNFTVDLEKEYSTETVTDSVYGSTTGSAIIIATPYNLSTDKGVTGIKVNGTEATASSTYVYSVILPYNDEAELPTEAEALDITLSSEQATCSTPVTTDGGATWTFTVTAEDGSTTNYTVHVSIGTNPTADDNAADIDEVKNTIAHSDWNVDMDRANTEQTVRVWVETKLAGLDLQDAQAEVEMGAVTPAVAGTSANTDGTDGSFSFTVTLNKGQGPTQATGSIEVTGTIIATPFTGGGVKPDTNIRVTFRLIGATEAESNIDLKSNKDWKGSEYQTWIRTTSYTLPAGSTMYDLFVKALDDAGLSSSGADSNYVKTIYAPSALGGYKLSEFTNGKYSGWMYTVDGKHPGVGLKSYKLSEGDTVIWHYVNDYRYEVNDWFDDPKYPALGDRDTWNTWLAAPDVNPSKGGPTGGNPGGTVTPPATGANIAPKVTAKEGVAEVTINQTTINTAIANAKKNNQSTIVITPNITGEAQKVNVELPKTSISSMVSETDATLKVETPVGTISIPQDALTAIATQAAGSTVTMSLESVDKFSLTPTQQETVGDKPVYDISIMSGSSHISSFNGKSITISLPYTLQEGESVGDVKVWYLNDAGELEQIDCTYDEKAGLATFKTSHLSYYLVGVEAAKDDFVINFTDVKESDWFYEAVKFAVEKGLFKGTGETTFSPHQPMTRAMLVTVLYNLEGSPGAAGANNFTDVKNGEWYTNAVIWANAKDIVSGYGKGLFGTNDPITREQMASILYRYASYKGYDVTATANLSAYTDEEEISNWAKEAMNWANAEGLITGRTKTTLVPGGTATRAEVASILKRFVESFME